MAKTLEIRITFTEDQRELYDYIKKHSSHSGFLKDLAMREMERDKAYVNFNPIIMAQPQQIIQPVTAQQQNIEPVVEEEEDFIDLDELEQLGLIVN